MKSSHEGCQAGDSESNRESARIQHQVLPGREVDALPVGGDRAGPVALEVGAVAGRFGGFRARRQRLSRIRAAAAQTTAFLSLLNDPALVLASWQAEACQAHQDATDDGPDVQGMYSRTGRQSVWWPQPKLTLCWPGGTATRRPRWRCAHCGGHCGPEPTVFGPPGRHRPARRMPPTLLWAQEGPGVSQVLPPRVTSKE